MYVCVCVLYEKGEGRTFGVKWYHVGKNRS